jgi:hypothetical protein
VSLTLNDNPIPGEAASALGPRRLRSRRCDTLLIQHPTIDGYVFPTALTADSTFAAGDHTVAIAAPITPSRRHGLPGRLDRLGRDRDGSGSMDQGDLFSVKLVGTLANFGRPVVYVAPKVQITKGFNLSFSETSTARCRGRCAVSCSRLRKQRRRPSPRDRHPAPGRVYAA